MVPGRARADFRRDVADSLYKRAETIVLSYLRDTLGLKVFDVRSRFLGWDFIVEMGGRAYRIDVKADRWIDRTFNIPFEDMNVPDDGGAPWPGNGRHPDLDFLFVVGVDTWRFVPVNVPMMRAYVDRCVASGQADGWTRWECPNTLDGRHYTTTGWAVPGGELWRIGALGSLGPLPVPQQDRRAS